MNSGLVSIIIPCYNYAAFIGAAIESLQLQSCTKWECIVVDDGSTDETAAVVKQYSYNDVRIHYYYQQNKGQPAARNKGLKEAKGDWVQFLDADDLLQPQKLQMQVEYLRQHPDIDIVYSDVRYFTSENGIEKLFKNRWDDREEEWMQHCSGKGTDIVQEYIKANVFELGCALFRKKVIMEIGFFDEALQGVEDYDYCLRAAFQNCSFAYYDALNAFVLMRHHNNSYSKGLIKMYKKELMMRSKVKKLLRQSDYSNKMELVTQNHIYYQKRLRRLQELLIDGVIKGNKTYAGWSELKWQFFYSDTAAKFYFFPRILKARFLH
jgi:glycosyltransferase involved in cell wall biosynthesis